MTQNKRSFIIKCRCGNKFQPTWTKICYTCPNCGRSVHTDKDIKED